MYYTAGIWLIYAGVVLRVLVRYAGLPQRGLVVLLFVLYGIFLFVEPWIVEHKALRLFFGKPGFSRVQSGEHAQKRRWLAASYLLVQTGLVVGLFSIPPHVDFFAGLFVPLSLQAVLFFGRRLGFLCIAIFPLAMFVSLIANARDWRFALTMSFFAGGLCLLFGSYSHQVQKAERARSQNQHMLGELQVANHQLRGYALQVDELAAEQERSRLARELHDSVTQTVFSMNLTVQSARLLLEKDPGRAAGQLERLEELAASARGEIQTLVSQLHPTSMAEEGLPAALCQLAVERQLRDGLQVALEMNGERALTEAAVAGLYRIVQEALTNVAKHAGTREATIRLNLGGDLALLEIEDQGLGFDPQAALSQRGHLGLAGMAERAGEIGWDLSVESCPGLGTHIRVKERPLVRVG
jgi:signal transduction histidine kinase